MTEAIKIILIIYGCCLLGTWGIGYIVTLNSNWKKWSEEERQTLVIAIGFLTFLAVAAVIISYLA